MSGRAAAAAAQGRRGEGNRASRGITCAGRAALRAGGGEIHSCFSNFPKHPGFQKGLRWQTSEHYFKAQKFAGTEHEEAVGRCKTAREAANMGRIRKRPLRADWGRSKRG